MDSRKKTEQKSNSWIFLLLICLATCFMSIGYAAMSPINAEILGTLTAEAQDGIFISNVVYDGEEITNSIIKSYYQTLLESTIELKNESASTITYAITLYNNSGLTQYFKETVYDEEYYDNSDIIFELDNLKYTDKIANKESLTFNITFKYKEDIETIENTVLNSFLKFLFASSEEVTKITIANSNNNVIIEELVDLETGTSIVTDETTLDGIVVRCNNGAIPVYTDGTLTISNITTETQCEIFDTLEEAIETADSTMNNILMIDNEDVTFEDSNNIVVASDKKINFDLNGMTINAETLDRNVTYIDNYGILKMNNSKESGSIQSNYRTVGNLENGELTIESGTYERTEADVYCGGTVTNFGGTVVLKNSTFSSDSTAAFLNWGTEKSVSLIDNCYLYTNTGDTVINASYDSEISISNSTITSSQGAAFKGAYLLSGASDENCGPTYVCSSTLSGIFDYYVPGLGRFYYASNVTFMNGDNTPYSNNSDSLIKNYTTTTDNEWYKVKSKVSGGQIVEARYSDESNIRVGDKIKIATLMDTNYKLEVEDGEFVTNQLLQIYSNSDAAEQEFTLVASSQEGYYSILPYSAPAKSLNISDPVANGTYMVLYDHNDDKDTRFEFIDYDVTEGNYYINTTYDLYFDVDGHVAGNQQYIRIYEHSENTSQKWKIERVE